MRTPLLVTICLVCTTGGVMAQHQEHISVPHEIGNRANGFSYQPTPSEVVPREALSGARPSKAQLDATDWTLESIDRSLLRNEGLSERDVPAFTPSR
jgi:hypothetical protein